MKVFVKFLALYACLTTGCAFSNSPVDPSSVDINLSNLGHNASLIFEVKKENLYETHLRIFMQEKGDWKDWERLKPLLGKPIKANKTTEDEGVPIRLRITISKDGDSAIVKQLTNERTAFISGDSEGAWKHVIDLGHLNKGKYRMTVENLRATPELNNRKTALHIVTTYQGK